MSLDKSQNDWGWIKAKDFMLFNPKESIKKGTVVKNVPMDKIEPKTKEIPSYELTEYKGGVKFRNGDILMARITPCLENGKISQVSILDYNEIGAGSTEFIVLREKEGISDKDFIYYLSNSEYFKEPAIKSMVGSSGRQRVQRDVVENLEIYVPPLETQKKIGKVLSFFDKKISLNKKINKNIYIALILTFILTGLGSIYAGNTKKGLTLLILRVLFAALAFFSNIFGILSVLVWVYGFYEVYNDVQIANRNSSPNLINDFKNWNQQNKIIAILIICAILILTLNSLISFSSTDSYPSDDSDTSNYVSYSYESPSSHYRGVDTSPDTLAKNDPDWYYDHYEYGDNPDIDDYLESEGYD